MKKLLIFCLSLFLQLGFLELCGHLYVSYFGDSLDKAKNLLEIDAQAGWQQKAGLNERFYDTQVQTNSLGLRTSLEKFNEKAFKVLVLGPSSTFGWGVEVEKTYASLLERGETEQPIQVINAGQIGFSSLQALEWLEKNKDWLNQNSPDAVIIAYGVNDIDRHRFYFQSSLTDSELFSRGISTRERVFSTIENSSYFLRTALRYVKKLSSDLSCPKNFTPPKIRVSFDEFSLVLEEFNKMFQERLILLDTAHAYPYDASLDKTDSLNMDFTKKQLKSELENNKHQNDLWYLLAQKEIRDGDCTAFKDALNMGNKTEGYRIARDIKKVNNLLEEFSQERNVPIIKGHSLIGGEESKELYFVDPIHPGPLGHKVLADKISEVVHQFTTK